MSDHSSLVATFKEKLRPRYYGKSGGANSRYIKENIYFNGIALKESLLYDNEYQETQIHKRMLISHNNKTATYPNNNKCLELEKGCFIYQNPASHYDDNDFIHKFTDMSIVNELGVVNSNYTHSSDTKTFNLKKNDREEIRKRLVDGYNNTRKSTKKSSLESRLQNSSNLQLCFMNEQSSDTELPINNCDISAEDEKLKSAAELKQGLNLAKNRARAHMISDQRNCVISAVIKESLSKVGVKLDNDRRRVSRHFLMRLNLAQLQVIVNDLHSYIEYLNESLVNLLLERDELHMAKDSMLVDIEDLKHVNRMSY
ncbi:schwannomin-interacting protein 1 isoform X1 [Acyrthosiphon pisum]|uniref:Schwannomin interacting protein 1 C-terminal domain-containing protein n=1 Tax=Acyrthosiphon pisum TaxID=7029 RepID=A0A8R1W003_ACYPI|nr:schwannomin-interacting protein 1 isoform X1 [Acyrthosiphon pisum]|eukprot:XP_001946132.1 PREDICTED: schwannomin-interacting protein 1 isoform X1 [Acyrthosiphon pisum]